MTHVHLSDGRSLKIYLNPGGVEYYMDNGERKRVRKNQNRGNKEVASSGPITLTSKRSHSLIIEFRAVLARIHRRVNSNDAVPKPAATKQSQGKENQATVKSRPKTTNPSRPHKANREPVANETNIQNRNKTHPTHSATPSPPRFKRRTQANTTTNNISIPPLKVTKSSPRTKMHVPRSHLIRQEININNLWRNLDGSSQYRASAGFLQIWKDEWRYRGMDNPKCSYFGCGNSASLGGHVRSSRNDYRMYIIPICGTCNNTKAFNYQPEILTEKRALWQKCSRSFSDRGDYT
ncbi:hypothetical protein DFJ77DRAFT_531303 [Powellomyces hirtus]|nr:hypothetical protein DFJ77DRAFT_531303 [Powellomyces hirtus]